MTGATVHHVGGGWYHVTRSGIARPVRMVRGRRAAERLRREMDTEPVAAPVDLHGVFVAMIDTGPVCGDCSDSLDAWADWAAAVDDLPNPADRVPCSRCGC